MHTTVHAGTVIGIRGLVIEVEVDIARGIPCFSIVGMPNTAVRESRERVTAAIKNSDWEFPLERITVNLAPADVRKEGAAFDVAIAVGILLSSEQIPRERIGELKNTILFGELALDGSIRRVPGVLALLVHAREAGYRRAIVPIENYDESLAVEGMEVIACARLRDAVQILFTDDDEGAEYRLKPADVAAPVIEARAPHATHAQHSTIDLSDVRGQETAKRALTIAAAGGHHILMTGPPGAGKTMLARRFATLLPHLGREASMETTMIYSSIGLLGNRGLITIAPFRSPHHSASDAGMIGGGNMPRPGEITLAHNGVLFLDELPEFRRHVLETLREPLEDGVITISRAQGAVTFPARFQLVAAMNPCPCGYMGSSARQCKCSPMMIEKYVAKISGPLLDRISLHVNVQAVDPEALTTEARGENSDTVRERVIAAHRLQKNRGCTNAQILEREFGKSIQVDADALALLSQAQNRLRISARGRVHILRVSRTIADLEESELIAVEHVAESIQYRVR